MILGGTFMRGREFLFDKENKLVRFVESDCSANEEIDFYNKAKDIVPKKQKVNSKEDYEINIQDF